MTTTTQMTRTRKWKFTTVGLTLCVVTKCHLKVKCDCFSCSVAKSCLTLCDPTNCSMSGFPVLYYLTLLSLLKLKPIESMMPSNHLMLCQTLLLLLSIFPTKASVLRRSAFFTVPTFTSIHDHRKNRSLD